MSDPGSTGRPVNPETGPGGQPVDPSSSWKSLALHYLRTRKARRTLTAGSRHQYRYVLVNFAEGMDGVPLATPAELLAGHVDRWLESHRWAISTICTNLGIIRPFLTWAGTAGYIAPGVASLVPNPRRPEPLPRALTTRHVQALLAVVPDARGRVIVLLEGQCGLRRAEVAGLDVTDVDLIDGSVRILHGKGGTQRRVYPSTETVDAIRAWMVERGPGPGALISSYDHPGARLTPTWIGMLVSRWMTEAGLKTMSGDGVSGHALRHTAATALLRDGTNIRVVQAALGHSSILTTARYLRADDPEVRAAMRRLTYGTRRLAAVPDAETGA